MHGKKKKLTTERKYLVQEEKSRRKEKAHGKRKWLSAKRKSSRQKEKGVGVGRVYSDCMMDMQAAPRHLESSRRRITTMFCSNCGLQLRLEDKYRSSCGTGMEYERTLSFRRELHAHVLVHI